MQFISGLLKISTMSVALLASTAIVATVATPDVAYAGKGNGGDKGNSGKSDSAFEKGKGAKSKTKSKSNREQKSKRGSSNNPLKSLGDMFKKKSDAPKVKRATKTKRVTKAAPVESIAPKPRGNTLAKTLGVHPSELGALNAANASPNALANASPNSRVGKLAIYAQQVEASRTLAAERAEAQAILDSLDAPVRTGEEIDAAIAETDAAKAMRLADLDRLIADLDAAGGTDETIEQQIEIATGDITAYTNQITALEQEREDGAAYNAAAEDLAALDDALATQSETQRAALEAAANKEVTDDVEAAVQSLLGIYEEPAVDSDDGLEDDGVIEEDLVVLE